MNGLLRVLVILVCFEMGALLIFIPWSGAWEHHSLLVRYPALIPYLLNPSVRGAVSGLGMLDVLLAAGMIRRRRAPSVATRS